MAAKLNDKHKIFISEYLVDRNATAAAIRAGYSEKTAKQQGSRLLTNADIKAEIDRRTEKRAERLEITADRVLQEIAKLAFMDPRRFFNSDSSPKQIGELDDDTAAALAGMEVVELFDGQGDQKHCYGLLKKYKLADKGQNLERLGKHLKLFTDRVEVDDVTMPPDERKKRIAELLSKSRSTNG